MLPNDFFCIINNPQNPLTMKTLRSLFIVVVGTLSFTHCSDSNNDAGQGPGDSPDVPLTDQQADFLAALPDTVIQLKDIILGDGQNVLDFLKANDPDFLKDYPYGRPGRTKALSPFQQQQLFFSRMYVMGYYLADDSQHTHPAAGDDSPAQVGLAYSWGSKDYNIRQIPPTASGCMDKKIYGLDCTGMIWAMTQAARITVQPKYNFFVLNISDAQKWTDAFKANADYKDLEMKDMGQLPQGKMRNGDILFWGSHVGVCLYGWFYQSNGTSNAPGCKNNLSPSRGPRMISIAEVLAYGLGPYRVFRTIHKPNYSLTIEHKFNDPCGYIGQNYYDAVQLDVNVVDDSVGISNVVNQTPTVSPLTMQIVTGCSLTCAPGSTGDLNITKGSGKVDEVADDDGNFYFTLDLDNTGVGAGSLTTLQCPDADPIIAPGAATDYTITLRFVLADSIQTQNSPGPYGVFIKLAPK